MNSKTISIIFVVLIFLIPGFYAFFWNQTAKTENLTCITKIEERIVRGNSLSGLIEDGQTVKILFGYYNCNEIERGDIIVYNYSGNKNLIIKIIKGLPGDKFSLEKVDSDYNILINDKIVRNSKNQPYVLDEKGYKMLSLYERDYEGIIPKNSYLILGNLAGGSLDSEDFGLVDKKDILGKVTSR